MRFNKKIKAGALQIVIVVGVVIAIILFAFISLIFVKQKFQLKNQNYTDCIYTTQQAFDYLSNDSLNENSSGLLSFFSTENKSVFVTKKQWGLFELFTVKTSVGKESFEKRGLLGARDTSNTALYLKDTNQPLVVVGNTKITGTAYLSQRGVTTGNIAGVSYVNNQLIYGEQRKSQTELPPLKKLSAIHEFIQNYALDTVKFINLEEEAFIEQSFSKATLVSEQHGVVNLVNSTLRGNLIIVSDTLIRVNSTATLEDVILIAPKIEVLANVNGNFQAFATGKISVQKNCQLLYPSALLVFNESNSTSEKPLFIGGSSQIKGLVGYFSNEAKTKYGYKPQIVIDTGVSIVGEVYCQGNTELKGTVFGRVYTNGFIANQQGNIYLNHLYNCVVNSEKLPKQFAGFAFTNASKNIAKWLY